MSATQARTRRYDLFVSYAEADVAWVEGYLLDALQAAGVRYTTALDFALGAPRITEFEAKLQDSRRTLLVLSPAYMRGGLEQFVDVLAETLGAEEGMWQLIPLIKTPVELPLRLRALNSLRATEPADWNAVVARLCREIQRSPPGPARRPACPYPGMVPFEAANADFFYGREDEIQKMLLHLRHQRLLVVIGPSGSGKSSLVSAGLLPRLASSGLFDSATWIVRRVRLRDQPIQALGEALDGGVDEPSTRVRALLSSNPHASRVLFIVDQFEELFTLSDRPRQNQSLAVLKAVQELESCTLILTLRADFFAELMESDLWPLDPSQRMEIAPLRGSKLRDAVATPARQLGVHLEAGLLERLMADAADEPGVLPLMQETMALLWNEMQRHLIPIQAYERLGSEGRSGLGTALSLKADATMTSLSAEQQRLARRIFLRLVQFGEGRPDTRRQQPVAALRSSDDEPRLFETTLNHLAQNRLLTLSAEESTRSRLVDIAHEALILGWPRLNSWLETHRESERVRRRLDEEAERWTQGTRGVLDQVELGRAERWLADSSAIDVGYSLGARELVRASRAALDSAVREARAAEEREQQLVAQSKTAAETQKALTLAAQAWSLAETDPDIGLLLARRAVDETVRQGLAVPPQAEDALHFLLLKSLVRATLRGHTSEVRSVDWSPDGRHVVTTSTDATARVWDATTWQTVATLQGHDGEVRSACWSPDGLSLATASVDGTARIWDATTFQVTATLRVPDVDVNCVSWRPDGRRIVTANSDGTARVWDIVSRRECLTWQGETLGVFDPRDPRTADAWTKRPSQTTRSEVTGVAWSPDAKWILAVSFHGTVTVWNAETAQERCTFTPESGAFRVLTANWSPDAKWIVSGTSDATASIWDAATGQERLVLRTQREMQTTAAPPTCYSVAWSADAARIVTASSDRTATIWDADSGRELTTLRGHHVAVTGAAWAPSGKQVITASADDTARIWEALGGEEHPTLRGHSGRIDVAAWSPDGRWLTTASVDGTARLWDAEAGQQLTQLDLDSWVRVACWSPDGRRIAFGCQDGTAVVYDVAGQTSTTLRGQAAVLESFTQAATNAGVTAIAWSPDCQRLATASADGVARVYDASTAHELAAFAGHAAELTDVAWAPDGMLIASASGDASARLWSADTGQEVQLLRGHAAHVASLAWSPDGSCIATASWDGSAKVWDTSTGLERMTVIGHANTINSVVWSPDGKTFLTSYVGGATVWDASNGQEQNRLDGPASSGRSVVSWSPDGQRIAMACSDGTATVWDAGSGRQCVALRGHAGPVMCTAWSPDGRRIVTASADGTARQYAGGIDELLALSAERLGLGPATTGSAITRRRSEHPADSLEVRATRVYTIPDYTRRNRAAGEQTPVNSLLDRVDRLLKEHDLAAASELLNAATDESRTAEKLNELGGLFVQSKDLASAQRCYERALAINDRALGSDHSSTISSLNNLCHTLRANGDLVAARPYFERALSTYRRVSGADHTNTITAAQNYGKLLQALGDFADAQAQFQQVLASQERTLSPDHLAIAATVSSIASVMHASADLTGARQQLERLVSIRERTLGHDHADTAEALFRLGSVLKEQGELGGARAAFERALSIAEHVFGPDHVNTATCLANLALTLRAQGYDELCAQYGARALPILESHSGANVQLNLLLRQALTARGHDR